jgi:hypothetical protein
MASSRLLASLFFAAISFAADAPTVGDGYVSYSVQNIDLSGSFARVKRQDSVPLGNPDKGTFYVVNRN